MLISPAKSLNMQANYPILNTTNPRLIDDSQQLINQLQLFNPENIKQLMKLSDKLSELNYQRFQNWLPQGTTRHCPALFAFQGDVYQGLAADTLTQEDIDFTQKHCRILSGLYGLLRPLDLMQAYRLEMGTPLKNTRGANLYAFWGNKISELINQDMPKNEALELVNLASNEYFKSIKPKLVTQNIITPVFRDYKNGHYKIISFYAKKARGMMVNYAIKHRITKAEKLKNFTIAGYRFSEEQSQANQWVFLRDVMQ